MWNDLPIAEVAQLLERTGGYLVVPIEDEEVVIIKRKEFNKMRGLRDEIQLGLRDDRVLEDKVEQDEELIDEANQELDENQAVGGGQFEEELPEETIEEVSVEPRTRVRFEPIKGDLPPELQG